MSWYYDYLYRDCKNFTPVSVPEITKNKRGDKLVSEYITADTETSHDDNLERKHAFSWVYQWAFLYNDCVVYGRTAREFVTAIDKIKTVNGCGTIGHDKNGEPIYKNLIVYIHNLSYDWEYLKEHIREIYGRDNERILATSAHNLITYTNNGVEYRCSLKLALKSLDKWARDVGTHYRKYTGAVNYNARHYPDTPLTLKDWKYQFYDVIVLHECIEKQMKLHGDTLSTIPLTSTGYVRRATRAAFRADKYARAWFRRTALNAETYKLCRAEFAGGITHGNRYHAGETVRGVIRHRDFRSHYPTQQRVKYCPVGAWVHVYKYNAARPFKMERLRQIAKNKCILAKIRIFELDLKSNRETLPYISYSKLKNNVKPLKHINDNGRVMEFVGDAEIVVNELDLYYILKQYRVTCCILNVWQSNRGKFPEYLRKTVDEFFKGKTDKKDILKQLIKEGIDEYDEKYINANFELMAIKALLNGIYGMSATDPIKCKWTENGGAWNADMPEIETALDDYYNSYNNFMSYQLGVWTTAHARDELMKYYYIIGANNFLYADTDSIFYISTPEIEEKLDAIEKENAVKNTAAGNYITSDNGKIILYDVFEMENEQIIEFRFLHAKCYAYTTHDGKLHTTIAGVSKMGRRKNTRVKELQTIENLKSGYIFCDCGGVAKTYREHDGITTENIDDHIVEIGGGCILYDTEKTLHNMLDWAEIEKRIHAEPITEIL